MKAYFPKIDENDKNVTVAFRYTPDKNHENLELRISASNAFGVFSDGKLIFRGPIRSAHGYSHVSNVEFRSVMPTCIVIEVAYYGINGFAYVDEPPFLDDKGVQAYCDALEAIQKRYSSLKIMAITHDPEMKARFPQSVDVVKTAEGSKVIYS